MTQRIQELAELVTDCVAVADEIIQLLDNFENNVSSRKWKSVHKALQVVWNEDKIERLARTLDSCRTALVLRILIVLNAKSDLQAAALGQNFEDLERTNQEIVEVISINQSRMQSAVHHAYENSEAAAQHRHHQTIAAILTLRNGDSKLVARQGDDIRHGYLDSSSQSPKNYITLRGRSEAAGPGSGSIVCEARRMASVHAQVLDCLHFRQISDRKDEVSAAYRKTFEWVFQDGGLQRGPWSDLIQWFKEGDCCYWVNGKAGAGKSTFMKFISDDPRTRDALSSWAGGELLLTASFYFWNLGSHCQKSQIGLLRSLLYYVLDAQPDLTAHILPDLYRAAVAGKDECLNEPSYAELKRGFHNLIMQRTAKVKICLFIDGLDEYEGSHSELAEFLASIPRESCVKVLVSSRPIPACVEVFSNCPKIQLQDLTYNDIRIYAVDKIRDHPQFTRLVAEDETQASKLIDEIVAKASGVFLWVIIVVKRLMDGLQNYDRLEDLRQRLEGLPTDLEELYNHMLEKLDPIYRRQASRIFQIVFQSITIESEAPLTTMHLSHTEEQAPESSIKLPVAQASDSQRYLKCVAMEGRVRSRCCGLVEVLQDWSLLDPERLINSRIAFLHRTVAEFLQTPEVWNGLLSLTADSVCDTNLSLLSACLVETKISAVGDSLDVNRNVVWRSMRACLQYARLAETSNGCPQTAYVDELDSVMQTHWAPVKQWHVGDLILRSPFTDGKSTSHWACSELCPRGDLECGFEYSSIDTSIYSLAASKGLVLYVREKWAQCSASMTAGQTCQVLMTTISSHAHNFQAKTSSTPGDSFSTFIRDDGTIPSETYVSTIGLLLENGADAKCGTEAMCRIWLLALTYTKKLVRYAQGFWSSSGEAEIVLWADMLKKLIVSGVDANARVEIGNRPGAHQQSALLIIMKLFKQLPPHATKFRPVVSARDTLRDLLEARGACRREWENGRLVLGPQEVDCTVQKLDRSTEGDSGSLSLQRRGFRKRIKMLRTILDSKS